MYRNALVSLQNKLLNLGFSLSMVDEATKYTGSTLSAFTYCYRPIASLKFYMVACNVGGLNVFKTFDNVIVDDKLDPSYVTSRQLIAVDEWNIKKIVCVSFPNTEEAKVTPVTFLELYKILVNVETPTHMEYGISNGSFIVRMAIDKEAIADMDYQSIVSSIECTFRNRLSLNKVEDTGERFYCMTWYT